MTPLRDTLLSVLADGPTEEQALIRLAARGEDVEAYSHARLVRGELLLMASRGEAFCEHRGSRVVWSLATPKPKPWRRWWGVAALGLTCMFVSLPLALVWRDWIAVFAAGVFLFSLGAWRMR